MVQLACQQREHLRSPRIVVAEALRRGLERLHALGVHRAEWLAWPPAAVGEHRAAEPVGVVELLGERGRLEQRLRETRDPRLALGLAQADQQLAALGALATGAWSCSSSAWRYQRAASSGASCCSARSPARRA